MPAGNPFQTLLTRQQTAAPVVPLPPSVAAAEPSGSLSASSFRPQSLMDLFSGRRSDLAAGLNKFTTDFQQMIAQGVSSQEALLQAMVANPTALDHFVQNPQGLVALTNAATQVTPPNKQFVQSGANFGAFDPTSGVVGNIGSFPQAPQIEVQADKVVIVDPVTRAVQSIPLALNEQVNFVDLGDRTAAVAVSFVGGQAQTRVLATLPKGAAPPTPAAGTVGKDTFAQRASGVTTGVASIDAMTPEQAQNTVTLLTPAPGQALPTNLFVLRALGGTSGNAGVDALPPAAAAAAAKAALQGDPASAAGIMGIMQQFGVGGGQGAPAAQTNDIETMLNNARAAIENQGLTPPAAAPPAANTLLEQATGGGKPEGTGAQATPYKLGLGANTLIYRIIVSSNRAQWVAQSNGTIRQVTPEEAKKLLGEQ